jgi:predicted RecA/RadA family phage recombinase
MKNYVQDGSSLSFAAPRTLSSGDGCLVGNLFGIANDDAASGATVVLSVEGVFDLTKDTSTFSAGDKVYWDDTAHKGTSTATSNKLIGAAVQAQVTGDTTVRVRLNEGTVV